MIVVTGSARTGTSLVMQTLILLGVNVVGKKFHRDFSNESLNPNGYWELPIEHTASGVHDQSFRGSGIKLFGLQLSQTPPDNISKCIVCARERSATIPSIKRLLKSEEWQLRRMGIVPSENDCEITYDENYGIISRYLRENAQFPVIYVKYERMIDDAKKEVGRIAEFVGVGDDNKINEAILNVRR